MAKFSVVKVTNGNECKIKVSGLSWADCVVYVQSHLGYKLNKKESIFITHSPHYRKSSMTYLTDEGEVKTIQYFIAKEK